jgi:CRISPR-associated endonuclease/helicase Cas3
MAVDSRYATEDELLAAGLSSEYYPAGWRLMAHQAKTIQALKGDAHIVINTAMTGDGKSLAGQLQVFNDRNWRTLTMYPTNELALDQRRSLDGMVGAKGHPPVWGRHGLMTEVINAGELDEVQQRYEREGLSVSRAEAVKKLLESDYLLTNPDIFHLCVSFAYRNFGAARDITLGAMAGHYRQFTFDEFHLFGTPQTASVMMAILLLNQMKPAHIQPRFLFLSATPQAQLQEMAKRVGLEVITVAGEYVHGLEHTPNDTHRRILRPVDLTLYSGGLEDWCRAHVEDVILSFFRKQRTDGHGAKGVIIANSVATAHRIGEFLKPICEAHGISVGLNTGLTPKAERAMDCDLLVGTSTIDVGVDFKINLLIFESRDAASHMQRLGRLGRHEADKDGRPFQHFEAHGLVPPWVVEGVTKDVPADAPMDRVTYRDRLGQYFQPLQAFESYVRRWAGVQAGQVLTSLASPEIRSQYADIQTVLKGQYGNLFGENGIKKYFAIREAKPWVVQSASSFRGDSPFTALLQDSRKKEGCSGFIAYNLLTLLRNADLQWLREEDIKHEYQKIGQISPRWNIAQPGEPLGAFRLKGWLEKRREIGLTLDREPDLAQREQVVELSGFRFDVLGRFDGDMRVSDELQARPMVCFLIPDHRPDDVRRMCRLGMEVELLRVKVIGQGDSPWTAAFGRDALLLDSVWRRRRSDTDKPMIY